MEPPECLKALAQPTPFLSWTAWPASNAQPPVQGERESAKGKILEPYLRQAPSRTVSWFPAPAASNPSCRFPAMGLPAGFRSRVMRPTRLAGLSVMTRVDEAGSQGKDPASRTATSDSTVASRDPIAPGRASDVAESSSLPSLWRIDMLTDSTGDRAVQERRVTQAESS